ncbi:putative reverse transcriptase domain-containing protein [Tanacetum coccineum]
MSIEEIMSEKRLIDDEINDITNDLSYKRFRGEKIDDEYERDCEIKIKQLLDIIARYSSSVAITSSPPDLPTEEPEDSLIMGDEHLDTIPEKESDELIKSSVENLVPIPSESKDFLDNESECDVLEYDETSLTFTTFSNPLFNSNDDFTSCDDESLSDEDVPMENFKIYSNPLFDDEEIISPKIDPHYFNAELNLIESLLNRDILIDSSPKFDYLLKEFSGKIEQGVTAALVVRHADRNTNSDDSHNSGTGELALLCRRIFPKESDKIEKYVGGLPDMIHGSVVASKPKTMQEAVKIATELIDKKIRTFAERQTESKRKQDDNQQQQQQNKRQNIGRAYTTGTGENKQYGGSKPLCSKCNYHHDGPCAPRCHKCNKVGHLARDCRSTANANNSNNQRGTGSSQKPTCYECGAQGHFKRDCPKLKNNNRGNQVGNGHAPAKVYAVGRAGTNPDSNVIMGMFLLNNRYASILFDTGADRSFVSTTFSSQIDITPTALDHFYDVELADGKIIRLNTIIWGCTLNLLNHPFNIDLIPVALSSLDVIIGIDWLAKYQAAIICAKKIVRIPWGNETLIVHGDESNRGNETRLNIISCTKTQKYMLKGCPIFLAHVTTKETGDKSEKKRLEDVPIV